MFDLPDEKSPEFFSDLFLRFLHAEIFQLRDGEARIAAGIDGRERREVHVDVQRDAVIRASARDADADRGDLRAFDVDARGARDALGAFLASPVAPEELDHRLLQKPDEALDLEVAPREVDQRIDDELPEIGR